jgi:hypothetical protein
MVVLNPADPLDSLTHLGPVKEKTGVNCHKRSDLAKDIDKRVGSVDEEARAWRQMIALGATEAANWEFAEYVYAERGWLETLMAARKSLLSLRPSLEVFFKTEDEIHRDSLLPNKPQQPPSAPSGARG